VRVAVLGATGTIGRALVPVLAREHEVVAVSRRGGAGPGQVAADATDEAALAAALAGVDVVYHLVHSLGSTDFEERDRRAAAAVARAAEHVGARQIVYLGGLGDGASAHLRSRAETAAVLAAGPVPVTTLRAAMVVGPGSAAYETIRALVHRLPVMVCPRWVSTPTQPVALADVVAYLAGVCGVEAAYGRSFDVGGPEVMTYREMMERVARAEGRRLRIVEVPVLSPWLSSLWLHLVTPVQASVARPLVEGMTQATVVRDGDAIRALVPLEPTGFDDAARA
jgi:uncharacterized protein YbjT (DUF2867 family)